MQRVQRADSYEVQGERFSVVSGSWPRATTGLVARRTQGCHTQKNDEQKTHELLHRQKWNGEA